MDSYCHLIACIDYLTEWSEAKPIRRKTALTVATFLYELMCRHACFEVQINYQGREFPNDVCTCLDNLTGVEQRTTYNLSIPSAIKWSCGVAKQYDKECLGKSTGSTSGGVTAYH